MTAWEQNLEHLLQNIEKFIRSETVVGKPIEAGGVVLVPLVQVIFGVGSGTRGEEEPQKPPEAGSGAGAAIVPYALVVISSSGVSLLSLKGSGTAATLIDSFPEVLNRIKKMGDAKKTPEQSG